MRTTRAFIAGIGTTGSLVAAAAGVFLVASAVIAFNGWPGTGFSDRIDSIFVDDEPPVAWDQPGTQAVAAGAATAAGTVAATPAGPTFGEDGILLADDGGVLRGGPAAVADGTIGPGLPAGAGALPGDTSGSIGDGTGAVLDPGTTRSRLGDTVRGTGTDTSRVVRETTRSVGNAVGGPVGDTVTQTGNTVGDTVDGVTNSAGSLLGG